MARHGSMGDAMICGNDRCGGEFEARPGQRFCCERCQQAAAKRRQGAGARRCIE